MAFNVGATAFGPLVLSFGFDRSGTYGPVLNVLLVIPEAAAAFLVKPPTEKDRARIRARLEATGKTNG